VPTYEKAAQSIQIPYSRQTMQYAIVIVYLYTEKFTSSAASISHCSHFTLVIGAVCSLNHTYLGELVLYGHSLYY